MKKSVDLVICIILILWLVVAAYAIQPVRVVPMTYKVLSTAVTVDTSADTLPAAAMKGRETICIFNNDSSTTVYIGHSAVSSTNGFPLLPLTPITIDIDDSVVVYGVTSAGSVDVRVLECK